MSGLDMLQTLDMAGFSLFELLASLLWQSSILLAAIGVISYALRRRNPSIRCILWVTALAILPILPIITHGLTELGTPRKEIAVMPDYISRGERADVPVVQPETMPLAHEPVVSYSATGPVVPAPPLPHQMTAAEPPEQEMPAEPTPFFETALQYPWSFVLIGYITGALLFLGWIVVGRLRIRGWIAHGAAVMDTSTFDIFHEAAHRLGVDREFLVIESDHVPAPLTCRTLRPVIILPSGLSKELSAEDLLSIALHELSHVRRNDVAVLSMLSIVKALLFFHPLVWAAIRQVSYLAELSCDACVLEQTQETASYAEMLTRIAGNLPKRAMTTELAAGFIFSKDMFVDRIRAIIDENHRTIKRLSKLALMATGAAAGLSLVLAMAFPLVGSHANEDMLSGAVVSDDGPVAEAAVYIFIFDEENPNKYESTRVASTDKDGAFSFRHDLSGEKDEIPVTIIAYRDGYAAGWQTVTVDEIAGSIDITLGKPAIVSGEVTDSDGDSIRGAMIRVDTIFSSGTSMHCSIPELTTTTDSAGRYTIGGLPEDMRVNLTVTAKDHARGRLYGESGDTEGMDIELPPEGRISGTVISAETGRPLSNAKVLATNMDRTLHDSSGYSTTDKRGKYEITGIEPGQYRVSAAIGDMYETPELASVTIENITVEAGRTTHNTDIELVKGGLIQGTVTDEETGAPLPEVLVAAVHPDKKTQIYYGWIFTDEHGSFRIRTVPGEISVYLASALAGYAGPMKTKVILDKIVEVTDEKVTEGVDFQIGKDRSKPDSTISGTVTHDGRPVSGADVYVIYRSGMYRWDQRGAIASHVKSDRKGEFEIDLPNHLANRQSPYAVVKAIKKGVGACQAPLSGTTQMPHYTLELSEAPSISGKVTDSDGNPVRGVDVRIAGMPELKARTGRNGRYTVSDISAGGNMMVFALGKGYAKSLRDEVYRGMKNVDFTLAAEGRITGHVYHGDSGKPAEGVRLYAVNINFREPSSETVTTDSNGAYTIPNLAAGMYHVTLAVDYDFPETAASAVRNVTVEAGRTTDAVDLTLVEGAVISGTVTDRDTGEALGNVHITASPDIANARYYSGQAISGADGSFKVRCAPGDFGLWAATPPGYVVEQRGRNISVSDGENIDDIHFTFSSGTSVTGRVLKPDGSPAPHMEVTCPIFQGGWQGSVMTDANGRFSISGLENNKEISIRISDEKNRLSLNTFALIQEGKELELTLEPYNTATVRGRIVDEAGEAVSGVAITRSKNHYFPNDEHRSRIATPTTVETVSDENGFFTVSGLIAGEKDVYISAEFPGYKHKAITFLEKIAPGETSLEDTVIEQEVADRWLEGYVTDTDGEPVVGVRLSLNDGNTAFSDERGYYRLNGISQIIVYDLSLDHHDYGHYRFENVPTNERRDIILIKPMYHLAGTVIDGDGNPVPNTRVSIDPWKRNSGFMYTSVLTDICGRFRIKAMTNHRVDILFYNHEKGLQKIMGDVLTNQTSLSVTLEPLDLAEIEHPLWEFDPRRISFLDDGNAPPLNISQWVQGDGVTLEDLRGKIVVLDFWTSENPKSVEGLTIMKALRKEYGEQDFVVLGIHEHTDDIEALRKLLADKGIDYPVAVDGPSTLENSMGATFDAYGLTAKSYPNIILDRDGEINRDIYDREAAYRVTMVMKGEKPYSPASPGERAPRGKSEDGIWHLNWEEGMAHARRENKPVMVKFDAKRDGEWLSTVMDSLYQSPEIQSRLANDWVCIRLDIWGPGTASFNGKEMGYNDLLNYFRSNTMATHIFFDMRGSAVQRVMEHILVQNKDHLTHILDYMRDEVYEKDITFEDYLKSR